jgi:hypothetical protein
VLDAATGPLRDHGSDPRRIDPVSSPREGGGEDDVQEQPGRLGQFMNSIKPPPLGGKSVHLRIENRVPKLNHAHGGIVRLDGDHLVVAGGEHQRDLKVEIVALREIAHEAVGQIELRVIASTVRL